MMNDPHQKVQASHLKRNAYVYVRQSTLRQVFENTESTKRQYGLRQRAVALGWTEERIIVIDSDLGQSGASSDREGFQRLVAEVGMGHAGIVLGLEVSRLARNSMDWHRLLEICALTGTLICDEDGAYDPAHFNDRLLLGLKGTMSEAELHVLRARLQGGILNKARRGELEMRPPVGMVYDSEGVLGLDPDRQVQHCLRWLFATFARTGSARATVKAAQREHLAFPRRCGKGAHKGELLWGELCHDQVLRVLHNPRYAGAFVYGRSHTRRSVDGVARLQRMPREQWITLIPETHAGYISWDEYEHNQRRLHESAQAMGADRRRGPAREGPALLQGLVLCGRCGMRMTVGYHSRHGQLCPEYVCQREGISRGEAVCQRIPGSGIDEVIGALLVEAVNPVALEVTLAVQRELQSRFEEADRLRHAQVERAQYECELAQRRYLRVDPDNRLVADSLEAHWNDKLRALAEAHEEYARRCKQDAHVLTQEHCSAILALASDFPRLWSDPATPDRERKRMVRLLLEDVTLNRDEQISVQIRFKGGARRSLHLPLPLCSWKLHVTPSTVVEEIDRLLNDHTPLQIAAILNERGVTSGAGAAFHPQLVARLARNYQLKPRYERLRERGLLTLEEMADKLQVTPTTVKIWLRHGLLRGHAYSDKNECLYEEPGDDAPRKTLGAKLSQRRLDATVLSDRTKGVQYEA
ncbi:recombinase family protein [Bordetella petrii]|uniref:Transposase n=1 Tax=Bordetella petrii (strain ATCC BAA-461 / DSM 12804 / CCUG 43448 / CIP 107267 / Se-1111R) TaxID=340100 RepID=A9IEF9_BORPD|nr:MULTISPECIES: recombinase family protein [Pseudomonadota]CAP41744.1 transposase [Bordetella petrii]